MAIALALGLSAHVSGCGASSAPSPRVGSALAASSAPTVLPRLGTSFDDTAVAAPEPSSDGQGHHHHHHHGGAHGQ